MNTSNQQQRKRQPQRQRNDTIAPTATTMFDRLQQRQSHGCADLHANPNANKKQHSYGHVHANQHCHAYHDARPTPPTPTPKPYSENITTSGGKVVSNDRYASTTIDIPPDAVPEEIIFTYEHRGPGVPVYRSSATGDLDASVDSTAADVRMLEGVRHFFVLKASTLDGDRIFILDKPISISVRYRADERGPVIDGTLEMYRHDGESYVQDNHHTNKQRRRRCSRGDVPSWHVWRARRDRTHLPAHDR